MPVDLDYYTILQLPPGSSADEVRDQWRRLAKAYHPDQHAGDPKFVEQLKLINLAYGVLRDPEQKAIYDLRYQSRPEPVKPAPKPAAPKAAPAASSPKLPVVPVFRSKRNAVALATAAVVILLFIAWQLYSLPGDSAPAPHIVVPAYTAPPPAVASAQPPAGGDADRAITAERAQEAQQLEAVKAPLLTHYQTALPQINALIAQSDSAVSSARNNSTLQTDGSQSEQAGLMVRLGAETGQLRASRDHVKSSLDAMQWYGTPSMWASQALEITNDLQEMDTLQQAVARDMGSLSRPSLVTGTSGHSAAPGFQGAPDFSVPESDQAH